MDENSIKKDESLVILDLKIQSDEDSGEEYQYSQESEVFREVSRRWGHNQDKELFRHIYLLEKKGVTSLKEIEEIKITYVGCQNSGLVKLRKSLGWKSGLKSLAIRIQK